MSLINGHPCKISREPPVWPEDIPKPVRRPTECVLAQFGEAHQAFLAAHKDQDPWPPIVPVFIPSDDKSSADWLAEAHAVGEALRRRRNERLLAENEDMDIQDTDCDIDD